MEGVLVTGATGFVGQRLCEILVALDCDVTKVARNLEPQLMGCKCLVVNKITGNTNWKGLISGHSCVIHLAARVHVMVDGAAETWSEYWRTNVDSTLNLAKQAAAAGVKRFIYMSSVKVNGEATYGTPFRPEDEPGPIGFYGQSKYEAEKGLAKIAAETELEVVIVRPPLVYGPEVKANFLKLLKLVHRGVPLPLGAVRNKRSFIYLDNLTDFIIKCISHPAAAGETFFVSDGEDLSTPALARKISLYMYRSARLIPVPEYLLKMIGIAFGKTSEIDRICGSLQVDISKAEQLLNWNPPVSVDVGLRNTVAWFLDNV